MKFIIIGLGSFGAALAIKLTELGHEVIGVDKQIEKAEELKEKITQTICLDCKNSDAIHHLPLKNTDAVIVTIGEDEGANILTTATLKNAQVPRLISRSVSPVHENVLEAMEISEIVRPEEETAERWAKKLSFPHIIDSFELTDDYSITEVRVPRHMIGKTVSEIGFNRNYQVIVLTIMKPIMSKNIFGVARKTSRLKISGVAEANTLLQEGDVMVLYGHNNNIRNLLKKNSSV